MRVDGRAEDRFDAVRDAFAQVLAEQAGTGAAVAAWWDGAWVVDLWGGWADAAATRPWRADSLVQPYSVSKPFAAICALVLAGRLLSPALLREATTAQCAGVDAIFGEHSAWGLGFAVDADGFGMGGSGGSYAGASTAGGYAFAFVTGTMGSHDRATMVENAFRECLGMPPLDE